LTPLYRAGDFGAVGPDSPSVTLTERRPLTMTEISGVDVDEALLAALAQAAGVAPPIEPNLAATVEGLSVLWMGPGRWLIVTTRQSPAELAETLSSACADTSGTVVDVSHGRTAIRVIGSRARELIAKGCPLDLHPSVFSPGNCAQSMFAGVSLLLHAVDDRPCFDLYFPRSYAASVWEMLADMAGEFGYRVEAVTP
jgi:sarcosine oxidase subunit gamma